MTTTRTLFTLTALIAFGCALAAADQPTADPADVKTVVADNTAFAVDLYGQLQNEPGNLFFSPHSISAALAMTYAGARTQTAEEMAKTMHFTLPPDRLHAAMGKLQADLNGGGKKRPYQLDVANALWGSMSYGWLPDFLDLTRKYYGAGFNEVDFGKPEAARKTINDWVEKQTKDKIKELIPKGEIDPFTRLVLTNAIYFKSNWESKFNKDKTDANASFFLKATDKVETPMMRLEAKDKDGQPVPIKLAYHEEGDVQVLEMPYAGKELSMVVLLPRQVGGLSALEKTLTANKLQELLGKVHIRELSDVSLPRFKMIFDCKLNEVLMKLGMKRAFTDANFSGMSRNAEADGLHITAVLHKAFVEVNEEGTEAAAATAVILGGKSRPPIPPSFRADHPFLFVIRDNQSGAVLFMGRVADPRKEG